MAHSDQIRVAWSRQPDQALLHAFFLEKLSHEGLRVVTELVTELVGNISDYVHASLVEQGQITATFPVRGVDIDASVNDQAIPLMWGYLVLAEKGIGFIPGGHDDDLGDEGLEMRALGFAGGDAATFAGMAGRSLWRGLKQTMRPISDLGSIQIPVPLLARLEPTAIWLPHGTYDALCWGPDLGEILRAGSPLLSLEPPADAEPVVDEWAAEHHIPLTAIAPGALFRG